MTTRICKACNRELPETEEYFYKHHRHRGGLGNTCRECRQEYYREKYRHDAAEREKIVPEVDKLISEPKVKIVPGAGCVNCPHEWDCRELVLSGRQVLCAPVFQSDLLLERAYIIRQEERRP